jgi:hypothetical protein
MAAEMAAEECVMNRQCGIGMVVAGLLLAVCLIESFATNLFNAWGIGDAERNDGVLLLVARDDRLVRIELGAGYDPFDEGRLWTVFNEHILSDFGHKGLAAVIARVMIR